MGRLLLLTIQMSADSHIHFFALAAATVCRKIFINFCTVIIWNFIQTKLLVLQIWQCSRIMVLKAKVGKSGCVRSFRIRISAGARYGCFTGHSRLSSSHSLSCFSCSRQMFYSDGGHILQHYFTPVCSVSPTQNVVPKQELKNISQKPSLYIMRFIWYNYPWL